MKILIKVINSNKIIFQLCFNIKMYTKSHITILDKDNLIKKWINIKGININNFDYFDVLKNNISDYDQFNLVLGDYEYNYKFLFDKILISRNNDISIKNDIINYNYSINNKSNFKNIDTNIKDKINGFEKFELKICGRKKLTKKVNVNLIFYGFKKIKGKINFSNKLRKYNKTPTKDLNIFYSCPNYLNELNFNNLVEENVFHKTGFKNVFVNKINYNDYISKYIKELKKDVFVKNYLQQLKTHDRTRFIRIYSMINSIIDSINIFKQNINVTTNDDIFILSRFDTFKANPRIRFFYDLNYYKNSMFIMRDKFHPSVEDRLIILNKKQILELSDYLIYIKNNLKIAIDKELIVAKKCVFSPEFTIRNFFAKKYFLYYYNNFDLRRLKINSKKNTNEIFDYYDKMFFKN